MSRSLKAEKRAIRGARAEERIGDILEDLESDYSVLHDVTSPHGNIDHVVISARAGIFLIETKAHGGSVTVTDGAVLVNGRHPEKNFVSQTLKNTYWLKERIRELSGADAWITPVLVFVNAFVPMGSRVKGIQVINRKYLGSLFREARPASSAAAVWEAREKIADALSGRVTGEKSDHR